jgi:hypothetical protein
MAEVDVNGCLQGPQQPASLLGVRGGPLASEPGQRRMAWIQSASAADRRVHSSVIMLGTYHADRDGLWRPHRGCDGLSDESQLVHRSARGARWQRAAPRTRSREGFGFRACGLRNGVKCKRQTDAIVPPRALASQRWRTVAAGPGAPRATASGRPRSLVGRPPSPGARRRSARASSGRGAPGARRWPGARDRCGRRRLRA